MAIIEQIIPAHLLSLENLAFGFDEFVDGIVIF